MQLLDDDLDLSGYMAQDPDVNQIKPAGDWTQEVINHFYAPVGASGLPKLPWKKTRQDFEFRPGELSIIAGINGHGKSQMWGQVVLDLCSQHQKVCVASLEMKPFRTMARMARQASAEMEPPIPFLRELGKWTTGKLWLYDKLGQCPPQKMLAMIRYAADQLKIEHFVVDNLTKIIPGDDNYSEQKDFVSSLCALAADLNIHIHLVLHMRKGEDEDKVPNKMSIKGSGGITDMADNVFIVWRNKKKERLARENNNSKLNEPDAILILDKQRNGETEGSYSFWFDRASMQYLEARHAEPVAYRIFQLPNEMS